MVNDKKLKNLKRLVKCPSCKKQIVYDESNPFRPFCSNRCKTADIAAWATDTYKIPGESAAEKSGLESKDHGEDDSTN